MNQIFYRLWKLSPQLVVHKLFPALAMKYDPIEYFDNIDSIATLIGKSELTRLRQLPRYTPASTYLYGKAIKIIDAGSYLCMLDEIFIKKNYLFKAKTGTPLIVDCGANIGLSIIFFKLLYPDSRIVGFEPDPVIYKVLSDNVKSVGIKNIEIHNKAVWDKSATVSFKVEGSWGGRIIEGHSAESQATVQVETVQLKKIIADKKVAFLKIDVEGAETDIIFDCRCELSNVDNFFFEYHSFVGKQQKLDGLLNILSNNGFKYYIREAAPRRMPFIDRIDDGMDLQLDVCAYKL